MKVNHPKTPNLAAGVRASLVNVLRELDAYPMEDEAQTLRVRIEEALAQPNWEKRWIFDKLPLLFEVREDLERLAESNGYICYTYKEVDYITL